MPLWPLPLVAGLLPAIAGLLAWQLSVRLDLIPACNPFLDGCVSISRAARHDLPNRVFQALVLPAAVLQGLTWRLAADWLGRLDVLSMPRARLLAATGAIGAVFLILYGSFLGTEGDIYRWLRRFGIVFYFGFTAIALIVTVGLIARAARRGCEGLSRGFARLLLALAWSLLAIGLVTAFAPLVVVDDGAHERLTNVLEWFGALLISLFFVALARAWYATRFGARLDLAQ